MSSYPIASIIIPTYNRPAVLAETLGHLADLDRIDEVEVLVFDDGSDEVLGEQLGPQYPHVTFIREEINRGQCYGRNVLMRRARADVLVGLDDDSWFVAPDAISRTLRILARYPSAGMLSFRIVWADGRAFPARRTDAAYRTQSFIGCGYAMRRAVAQQIGYYEVGLRRAGEERDLALRVLDAGYDILQISDIDVYHLETHVARDEQGIHALAFRNEMMTPVLRYPLLQCVTAVPKAVLSHTRFCMRQRWYRAYRQGLLGSVRMLPWALRHRSPVRTSTVRTFRRLARPLLAESLLPTAIRTEETRSLRGARP